MPCEGNKYLDQVSFKEKHYVYRRLNIPGSLKKWGDGF